MIEIKYTEDNSYIRITNPTSSYHNIGYISPSDGELSAKQELLNMITKANLNIFFKWKKGCGRHGGTGYESHTLNQSNVNCTIEFVKRVIELNKLQVEVNMNQVY